MPIKVKSDLLVVTQIRKRFTNRFYRNLKIGSVIQIEQTFGKFGKTTKATIFNVDTGKHRRSLINEILNALGYISCEPLKKESENFNSEWTVKKDD